MSVTEMRREAMRALKTLPNKKVPVAHDFIRYLEDFASNEATAELLNISGLPEDLKQAKIDQAAGKFTPFEKLQRKYKRHV